MQASRGASKAVKPSAELTALFDKRAKKLNVILRGSDSKEEEFAREGAPPASSGRASVFEPTTIHFPSNVLVRLCWLIRVLTAVHLSALRSPSRCLLPRSTAGLLLLRAGLRLPRRTRSA